MPAFGDKLVRLQRKALVSDGRRARYRQTSLSDLLFGCKKGKLKTRIIVNVLLHEAEDYQ